MAGTVVAAGAGVERPSIGTRVCLHYLVSCGACRACRRGDEQFCGVGGMIGFDRQGGYAERIVVPARNAFPIPDVVDTEVAAVMMCSTATVLHALHKARLAPGETVAVFGVGGLGASAVRLAPLLGSAVVYAVDLNPAKLDVAASHGAVPVPGGEDAVERLLELSGGGVDVALELVGSASLMRDAVATLRSRGRAVAVGITDNEFGLDPFRDLILREAEIIGAADHLASEIELLLDLAGRGALDLADVVTNRVPLEVAAVDGALDRLEQFGDDVRTVIAT